MLDIDSLFDKFQTKADNRFESVDEYFKTNTIETTHMSTCVCGCVDITGFFDILRKEYEVVKEFLEYCFEKNYIKKDDETFQLKCATKIQIYTKDCFQKYMYILKNVLTPSIVKMRLKIDNTENDDSENAYYNIFHVIGWGYYSPSENEIKELFDFFDSINFDFSIKGIYYDDFLSIGIMTRDLKIISSLLERGAQFTQKVFDYVIKSLYENITSLKEKIDSVNNHIKRLELSENNNKCQYDALQQYVTKQKLYNAIYYSDEIQDLFKPEFLIYDYEKNYDQIDIEFEKIMKEFCVRNQIEYSDKYWDTLFHEFNMQGKRYDTIRPPSVMENFIQVYRLVEQFMSNEMKSQLLKKYMEGSRPIEKIFPDFHQKFCEMFS